MAFAFHPHAAEEELASFCAADRFDGFDRGDLDTPAFVNDARVIGRMRSAAGRRVEIIESTSNFDTLFFCQVDGQIVGELHDERGPATAAARLLLADRQPS